MKLIRAIFDGRSTATPSTGSSSRSSTRVEAPSRIRWWPATSTSSTAIFKGADEGPLPIKVVPAVVGQHRCCDGLGGPTNEGADCERYVGGATDDYDVWSTTAAFPRDGDDDYDDVSGSDVSDSTSSPTETNLRRSRRCRSRMKRRNVRPHVTFTTSEDETNRFSEGGDDDDGHVMPQEVLANQCDEPSPRQRSGGGNPLLETISAIEDLHESDDEDAPPNSNVQTNSSDGERDSTGYSSSNSMDSGYKSSCPALTEALERQQEDPSQSQSRNFVDTNPDEERTLLTVDGKPLSPNSSIAHFPPNSNSMFSDDLCDAIKATTSNKTVSISNRLDNGFYDVNLDHLMYLRQSLLGATKRCTTSGGDSRTCQELMDVHPPSSHNFDSKILASGNCDAICYSQPPRSATTNLSKILDSAMRAGTHISSAEQPCCCGCCRQAATGPGESAGAAGHCGLSPEDGQAHNRAEYYDLENVNEFPCAYGTMVEHRFNNSCLARVKKLKESSNKPLDADCSLLRSNSMKSHFNFTCRSKAGSAPAKEPGISTSDQHSLLPISTVTMATVHAQIVSDLYDHTPLLKKSDCSAITKQNREDRERASEVTKCILKIIDDIQQQQQYTLGEKSGVAITNANNNGNHQPSEAPPAIFQSKSPSIYDSRRLSGADYHVYEEIAYGLAKNHEGKHSSLRHPHHNSATSKNGGNVNRRTATDAQYVNVPQRKVRTTPSRLSENQRLSQPSLPPPLPARPNEIFGNCTGTSTMGQLSSTSVRPQGQSPPKVDTGSPSKSGIQIPCRTVVRQVGGKDILNSDGRRFKPRKLSTESNTVPVNKRLSLLQKNEGTDDDYGFKLIKSIT